MAYKVTGFDIIDDTRRIINTSVVGVGTTVALASNTKLHVQGDSFISGITTSLRFVSNVAGGTAPISVASSTRVDNLNVEFLNNQPGSYYLNAGNLTGIAPGAVITQSNGLTVTGNLNVSGNVSIGGTSTLVYAQQLKIADRDITLGVTTAPNGDDIATDATANHGGIAIASTEGTPLVNVPLQVGLNTDPFTYKQLMWIRSGNFTGFSTDAWLFNYAVAIGNTSTVQNGSRLTVGLGFTVYEGLLESQNIRATSLTAPSLNVSGLGTVNTLQGTNVNFTGVGTVATLNSTVATLTNLGGTNLNYSGLGTIATLQGTNVNFTGVGTVATLNSTVATLTNLGGTNVNYSGIGTVATLNSTVATLTNLGGTNVNFTGVGTVATLNSTVATLTNLGGTNVNYTGIGSITNLRGTNLNYTGIVTAATYALGATTVINTVNSQITLAGIQTIDAATKATFERELAFAPNAFDDIQVSGISTFTNGPVLVGGGASTGTALQRLQVTGGAYVSGSVGVGTTNPTRLLDVNGEIRLRAGLYDSTNALGSTNQVLSVGAGGSVTWQSVTSVGAISGINVSEDNTGIRYPVFAAGVNATTTALYVDTPAIVFNTQTSALGINTAIPIGQFQVGAATSSFVVVGAANSTNIGIGTATPTQNLDVNGNVRIRGGIYDSTNTSGSNNQVLSSNGSGGWSWQSVTAVGALTGISITDDNTGIRYPLFTSATSGSVTANFVDSTGLVYNTATNCLGIGSLTPTSQLDVIGGVKVVGVITATDFNSSSDKNLKNSIKVIEEPIKKVLELTGVSFSWNETGKPSIGVIAQEVEQVFPELVSDTEPKSVNYNGLIGLLIECVKEQQKQIEELKIITSKKSRKVKDN